MGLLQDRNQLKHASFLGHRSSFIVHFMLSCLCIKQATEQAVQELLAALPKAGRGRLLGIVVAETPGPDAAAATCQQVGSFCGICHMAL